ncbi:MAG: type II toxin-antitoxin system Phd/YefM family antitoxin [Deltaproteobacteria bacterium]|nr:type II toxin-antitoxin system Phd/YefM family antitoxin [Deltaproteobacteria bacterium]
MKSISASAARANLYRLIDEAAASHEPTRIAGKRNDAVLVSAEDWASVEETLFLLSIPGMRESIMEGLETPPDKCSKGLKW